jgi:hypothetical protein
LKKEKGEADPKTMKEKSTVVAFVVVFAGRHRQGN